VDFHLPWAHLERPPFIRKALSLCACAATFPRRSEWDLIIGDGPQHLPIVMKILGLLRPHQKALPYLAGEFPYFLTGQWRHQDGDPSGLVLAVGRLPLRRSDDCGLVQLFRATDRRYLHLPNIRTPRPQMAAVEARWRI
jgi:hypothetical protein